MELEKESKEEEKKFETTQNNIKSLKESQPGKINRKYFINNLNRYQ